MKRLSLSMLYSLFHVQDNFTNEIYSSLTRCTQSAVTKYTSRAEFLFSESFERLRRNRRNGTDPEAAGASKQTEVVVYNSQEGTKSNCTVKVTRSSSDATISTFDQGKCIITREFFFYPTTRLLSKEDKIFYLG